MKMIQGYLIRSFGLSKSLPNKSKPNEYELENQWCKHIKAGLARQLKTLKKFNFKIYIF